MSGGSLRVLQGHPERRDVYELVRSQRGIDTREILAALPYGEREVRRAIRKLDGVLIQGCGRRTVSQKGHRCKMWEVLP